MNKNTGIFAYKITDERGRVVATNMTRPRSAKDFRSAVTKAVTAAKRKGITINDYQVNNLTRSLVRHIIDSVPEEASEVINGHTVSVLPHPDARFSYRVKTCQRDEQGLVIPHSTETFSEHAGYDNRYDMFMDMAWDMEVASGMPFEECVYVIRNSHDLHRAGCTRESAFATTSGFVLSVSATVPR